MRRTILYIGILAALFFVPVEQMEVGKLIPVQVVSIYKEDANYVIETDTENKGLGSTAQAALQNLKDTADGTIYLDTAQYLLITQDTRDAVEILRKHLKPSVEMSAMETPVKVKEVAQFLESHGRLPKLKQWKMHKELPVLSIFEDSYIFLKKVENNA